VSFAREHRAEPPTVDAAEASLRELPEALVVVFDADLAIVSIAGHALQRLSHPGNCREGRPLADALPSQLWRRIEPLLHSALRAETRSREIWTAGQQHCVSIDAGPLVPDRSVASADCEPHAPGAGVVLVLDVSARRRAELLGGEPHGALEQALARARREAVGTGVLDCSGRWMLVNRALCDITGYTADELLGTRLDGIVHPDDAGGDRDQRRALLAGDLSAYQVRKRYFDAAGETVSGIVSISLVRDRDGAPRHLVAQLQDVSERRDLEDGVRGLADHDVLTGLRNRRLFAQDLKLQVARSRRYGEVAGLMLIELEPLPRCGELGAQDVSDVVLGAVSRALTRRLRETDVVARLGADRFSVLLPHIDEDGLAVVAEGLDRVIGACGVEIYDDVIHPSARIGFALVDANTDSADAALAAADRALRSFAHAAA
jgi:diguanylate cyclase (GGDEF)-like protein/PAS domain S-box-containing protein